MPDGVLNPASVSVASAFPPPVTNGVVIARAKPATRKRSRTKALVATKPIEPGSQPSPKVIRYQAVIRAALDGRNPPLAPCSVPVVRRRIAQMALSLPEMKEMAGILVSVANQGPAHVGPGRGPMTAEQARARIVQPFGVTHEAYWEAAWLALRAIISEAGRRQPNDLQSVWLRLDIVTMWPGALDEKECGPVLGRLTRDLRRILNGRIPWYPPDPTPS